MSYTPILKVKFQKLSPQAKMPFQAHAGDAGSDLFALENETLEPSESKLVSTGLAIEVPIGYVGLIFDRSSMGKKGIKTLGGVIDAGYRGELKVILRNLSKIACNIQAGDRVAQLLILPIPLIEWNESVLSESERGMKGFGSSGI